MTKIAVVGASGAVGRTMLELLEQPEWADLLAGSPPVLYASPRSRGLELPFNGEMLSVRVLGEESIEPCDIALFSAGGGTSKKFAQDFVDVGAVVVDNSSAFRLDESVPLVVPEVNPEAITTQPGIIANPNCSTIILLMALKPLVDLGNFRAVVATYQAVSGAGQTGLVALENEQASGEHDPDSPFPTTIHRNLIALIGDPSEVDESGLGGDTSEELKMQNESRKILGIPDLDVYTTCVRVPVARCHSEAVTLLFDNPVTVEAARERLHAADGVILEDDPCKPPVPLDIAGAGPVSVGRLRSPQPNVLQMWVVGDQLLKGAALNAVQIARAVVERRGAAAAS